MSFRDLQDYHYYRFRARHVLRLDIVLRTNIIDKSGLFDIQGRPVPLEWVSWTHNCKTITLVAKNKGNVLLQLCRFPSD